MTIADHPGNTERVVIAHGGGGELTGRLLREHVLGPLENATLASLTDGAVLPAEPGELVFTTDSYVVTPIEFPGGNIGRLAIAGTVNDLAVMGATPRYLSLALVLEEGLALDVLDRVVATIADTAQTAGIRIVTGDTKVIERRQTAEESGMIINTAGVGWRPAHIQLGIDQIRPGDQLLVNGPIAEHGLAIMSVRHGLEFESALRTDAAPLHDVTQAALQVGGVRFLRDATRGGIAGVLADLCEGSGYSIEIDEPAVPITPTARHAAEMLGLDPLTVANEGKLVAVVAPEHAAATLAAWRATPLGKHAAVIGRVTDRAPALTELLTRAGGRRIVQRSYGEELPRIC